MKAHVFVPSFIAVVNFVFVGCQPAMTTTGGDTPVNAARLENATLTFIGNKGLLWTFEETTLEVTNRLAAIPSEFASEIVGKEVSPKKIQASWELTDGNRKLRLFNIIVDDETLDSEAILPISPAGHVRLNLGSHQYNRHRTKK